MTTADLHAAGLADGCPTACGNVEPPAAWMRVGDAWRCGYLCSDCGETWTTDWRED
jgi:hypothetical protein